MINTLNALQANSLKRQVQNVFGVCTHAQTCDHMAVHINGTHPLCTQNYSSDRCILDTSIYNQQNFFSPCHSPFIWRWILMVRRTLPPSLHPTHTFARAHTIDLYSSIILIVSQGTKWIWSAATLWDSPWWWSLGIMIKPTLQIIFLCDWYPHPSCLWLNVTSKRVQQSIPN